MRMAKSQAKNYRDLREEKGMKFIHEAVIQWREVFQAIGAGLFQTLEKKYL